MRGKNSKNTCNFHYTVYNTLNDKTKYYMTAKDVGNDLGVSKQTIHNITTGRYKSLKLEMYSIKKETNPCLVRRQNEASIN